MSNEVTAKQRERFMAARKTSIRLQWLLGPPALVFGALALIHPLFGVLALPLLIAFFYQYWVRAKQQCPRCGKAFGVGGSGVVGNGLQSCYHCGWHIYGKHREKPASHTDEWVQ